MFPGKARFVFATVIAATVNSRDQSQWGTGLTPSSGPKTQALFYMKFLGASTRTNIAGPDGRLVEKRKPPAGLIRRRFSCQDSLLRRRLVY
jgi:hypothetical protein